MLYKPKFCCNCGEKVLRSKWGLLSSRRFCELCETEHMGYDYFLRLLFVFSCVIGLFGLASYLPGGGRGADPAEPGAGGIPIQRQAVAAMPPPNTRTSDEAAAAKRETSSTEGQIQPVGPITQKEPPVTGVSRTDKVEGPVYYCGATTKKGTPCSRRVKNKGVFCWQHAARG